MLRVLFGALVACTTALVLLAMPVPARARPSAPTFAVNSTGDVHAGGDLTNGICQTASNNTVCTLRAAIEKADNFPGGGVIIDLTGVTAPATYTLSLGALEISHTLSIIGAGPSQTIIDGNGSVTNDRVLYIITHTVDISGVTITNGKKTYTNVDPNAFAGGILTNDALTLTNSIVRGNAAVASSGAAYGGGIYAGGKLTLVNSSVIGNQATTVSGIASGGGIVSGLGLTLVNSTVSGNTANDSGGGIYGGGTLINSTVSGNTARNGGGIYGGSLMLLNSTVSGNHAKDNGGGIYHSGGAANFFNVTITNNTANSKLSGSGFGGGIANASGPVNLQNTIVGGNLNVLINNGQLIANPEDCSGTLTSQGYNIVSEPADCTISGSFAQVSPSLGPLQDNGGPTLTHALLSGSPAIDTGQPGNCTDSLGAPITTDQRGFQRPADGAGTLRCDIGAYELNHKTDQQITFPSIPDKTLSESPFAASATASSGLAVTYTASGVCQVSGSVVSFATLGSCTLTAHQSGNDAYNPAPDVPQFFRVVAGNPNGSRELFLPSINK